MTHGNYIYIPCFLISISTLIDLHSAFFFKVIRVKMNSLPHTRLDRFWRFFLYGICINLGKMKLHRRGDKSFLCVRSGSLCNQDALDTLAEEISTSWSKMHNNYWQRLKFSRNTHCMYASKKPAPKWPMLFTVETWSTIKSIQIATFLWDTKKKTEYHPWNKQPAPARCACHSGRFQGSTPWRFFPHLPLWQNSI